MALVSFTEAATDAIRGATCALLATVDAGDSFFEKVTGVDSTPFNVNRALRRQICSSDPADDLPIPEGLLQGGQCPGTLYELKADFNYGSFQDTNVFFPSVLTGKVSVAIQPLFPGSSQSNLAVTDATGFRGLFGNGFLTASNVIALPRPGETDCGGNAPAPVPPFSPVTNNITINYGDDNEFTEEGDITFNAAYVDIDGSINAPITLSLGGIDFNGTIKLAPEFKIELFPNGITGSGGRIEGDLSEEPLPEDDGEPSSSDPKDVIVGAVITSRRAGRSRATGLPQETSGTLFVPRIGTVRFQCRIGDRVFWTEDQPIKGVRQIVQCPWDGGAISVDVTPDVGWAMSAAAVLGRPISRG